MHRQGRQRRIATRHPAACRRFRNRSTPTQRGVYRARIRASPAGSGPRSTQCMSCDCASNFPRFRSRRTSRYPAERLFLARLSSAGEFLHLSGHGTAEQLAPDRAAKRIQLTGFGSRQLFLVTQFRKAGDVYAAVATSVGAWRPQGNSAGSRPRSTRRCPIRLLDTETLPVFPPSEQLHLTRLQARQHQGRVGRAEDLKIREMPNQSRNDASLPGWMQMSIDLVDHENSELVLQVRRKPVVLGVPDGEVRDTLDDRLRSLAQHIQWKDAGGSGNPGEESSLVFSNTRKAHWKPFGYFRDH